MQNDVKRISDHAKMAVGKVQPELLRRESELIETKWP